MPNVLKILSVGVLTIMAHAAVAEEMPAGLPPVRAFAAPPAGFDAVAATDQERARYGLPPRPSMLSRNPTAYVSWLRAMTAAQTYVAPLVRLSSRRHGPAIAVAAQGASRTAFTSANWAGQFIVTNSLAFGPSAYSEVIGQWVLPAVQQPPGTCGGIDVSATWVGIDGTGGTSDVVQAGTEGDVGCANGVTSQDFYPWFEWYPDYGYDITNFIMYRGASIMVQVHAITATSASVTYVNLQNNQYTVASVTAPVGTVLHGNSVEWIMERPAFGSQNTLGTLADFGLLMMTSEIAYLQSEVGTGSYDVPGSPGGGRIGGAITMLDSNQNALASPRSQGTSALEIDAVGSTLQ